MDWVIQIGLVELALGGLLGWAMVLRQERPELLRRIGVVAPQRIRQIHLDYVMMGLILIGVGLAVPDLPTAMAIALVFGTAVNPILFLPLALRPRRRESALVPLGRGGLLRRCQRRPGGRRGRRPRLGGGPGRARGPRPEVPSR